MLLFDSIEQGFIEKFVLELSATISTNQAEAER